jgi:peroxiredoxin
MFRTSRLYAVGVLVLCASLVHVAAASDSRQSPEMPQRANVRKSAPDFALTDANGFPIRLSSYRGRVVLLDFWATWCTGCKVEIPWYIEFQKKYARRGLTSIGVAMDEEGWQKVKPYLHEHPINYPIVLGNPVLTKPYEIASMPVTLLIDRAGRIADAHIGIVDKDTWENEIQQLLKERFR